MLIVPLNRTGSNMPIPGRHAPCIDGEPQAFFALAQRRFGLLAFCDIDVDARHAQRRTITRAIHHTERRQPSNFAGRKDDTVFRAVFRGALFNGV